ncbi:MAG: DNA adenine methylase, partial [Bacteroidetes bacterium]|nr:DNA adenine methylase [Bacteroidota bacterium]
HEGLAGILRNRDRWILSYNDCPAIRNLYKGFNIITANWKYGMSNDKSSKEILIFSRDIHQF